MTHKRCARNVNSKADTAETIKSESNENHSWKGNQIHRMTALCEHTRLHSTNRRGREKSKSDKKKLISSNHWLLVFGASLTASIEHFARRIFVAIAWLPMKTYKNTEKSHHLDLTVINFLPMLLLRLLRSNGIAHNFTTAIINEYLFLVFSRLVHRFQRVACAARGRSSHATCSASQSNHLFSAINKLTKASCSATFAFTPMQAIISFSFFQKFILLAAEFRGNAIDAVFYLQ